MIPNEVIQVPAVEPKPAEPATSPTTEPAGPLPLEQVPEPGQENDKQMGILRGLDLDEPPTTEPATEPAEPR